jgi:murein DD-endopeptidase MepM/ murein hydrolase activator NlpD
MKFLMVLILLLFIFPKPIIAAQTWVYPISNFKDRQSFKIFGQYFDKKSYIGHGKVFPKQYYGYHAAVDLEILPIEVDQSVPVYAITDGKIIYAAPVTGYGGVILLQLDTTGDTALYGHVKLTDLPYKVGDIVTAGTKLAYLGDAYSGETAG